MSNWYKVKTQKRVEVFEVKPNTYFNINTIMGGNVQKVHISYSYKKCVPTEFNWDGTITLINNHPNYMLQVDTTTIDINSSIIQCFAIEGD